MGNFTNKHGGMEPAIFCVDGLYEYDPSTFIFALEILAQEENQVLVEPSWNAFTKDAVTKQLI